MHKLKDMLPAVVSLILAVGMVAASELFHEKEIIFPEITAVAIGALAAPKQAWNTSALRLFLTITAAAVLGVGIVFIPIPLMLKIPVALIAAVGCVTLSRTEFLPAVSACVLPVLLGTRSTIYIISVAVMTALILAAQQFFIRTGIRKKYDFSPVNADGKLFELRFIQIAAVSIIALLPAVTGEIFFAAPPLIVAFFEMSKPQSKLLQHIPQALSLIVIAAVSGSASRFFLTEKLGLPLTVSAAVVCAVILFAVSGAKLYFPPCGAIATLPLIVPSGALFRFPLEIAVGATVLTLAAWIIAHRQAILKKVLTQN